MHITGHKEERYQDDHCEMVDILLENNEANYLNEFDIIEFLRKTNVHIEGTLHKTQWSPLDPLSFIKGYYTLTRDTKDNNLWHYYSYHPNFEF